MPIELSATRALDAASTLAARVSRREVIGLPRSVGNVIGIPVPLVGLRRARKQLSLEQLPSRDHATSKPRYCEWHFAPPRERHKFYQVAPGHLRESRGSLEHLQDGAPIAGLQVFERLGIVFA